MSNQAERIMGLIDEDTWPTIGHLYNETDGEMTREDVASTTAKLIAQAKVVLVGIDGFHFLTTPERLLAHNRDLADYPPLEDTK